MQKKVNFDYSKLKGRIIEKFDTYSNFANAIGVSSVSLSSYLNNKTRFNQDRIMAAAKALEISIDELPDYFFCVEK